VSDFTLPNASVLSVYSNAELLATAVAQRIVAIAHQAIMERGVCRIGLAGGETPRRSYEQLHLMPVDWTNVHICFGDER
jgi:6-phosphogluconolactonase